MLRLAIAATALFAAGSLGAATCGDPAAARRSTSDTPTRLDYLLLASLADSQQMLSMVAYRPGR